LYFVITVKAYFTKIKSYSFVPTYEFMIMPIQTVYIILDNSYKLVIAVVGIL